MATRTTIMNKLVQTRGIAKSQISKAYNLVVINNGHEKMSYVETESRLESLQSYWKQFESSQAEIETTSNEENQEELEVNREKTEEMYIRVKSLLKAVCRLDIRHLNRAIPCQINNTESNITYGLHFISSQEDETFANFIRRFDNFLSLKAVTEDKLILSMLLYTLPPRLHEQLQDLVSPEDPYSMAYDSIVCTLKEHLEPSPSILSRQHKFVCRIQQNELLKDYSVELKKLAKHCQFNCKCGKAVSDLLLRMQFVRGLQDSSIRGQIKV